MCPRSTFFILLGLALASSDLVYGRNIAETDERKSAPSIDSEETSIMTQTSEVITIPATESSLDEATEPSTSTDTYSSGDMTDATTESTGSESVPDDATELPSAESSEANSLEDLDEPDDSFSTTEHPVSDCSNVCLTKGCTKAAATALQYMNLSADPCDDFFEFSCGGFVRDTDIEEEKTAVNSFSILRDKLQQKLRAIIEQKPSEKDSNVTKMVKNFYNSCMNTTYVDELGLSPLLKILDKLGGWPVIEGGKWNESNFDWIESVYKNRKIGYSIDYFFDFSASTDIQNSTKRMIWVSQTPLGLSREYLMKGINDSDVEAYLKYSIDIAAHLGADAERAKREMKEVLLFQMELANITLPREKMRNITKLYNLYSLKNLTKIIPEIPWLNYTNRILAPEVNVTEDEIISVSSIDFFKNFTKLMKKTPKRVQANYLMWRITSASVFLLPDKVRDIQLEYWKKVSGVSKRSPRWKECLSVVIGRLPLPVSHLYIVNYFDDSANERAKELVRYIREEFVRVLNATSWMDNKTKTEAFKKAATMKERIGYPIQLKNATLIYNIYKELKIQNGTFFDNILSQNIYLTNVIFSRLRKKIDKEDWQRQASVAVVNAFYRFTENAILFPAGILQGIFYEPDRPYYMNFGAIGFIIGHEITHGFDDRGKQFNSKGDLINWWQPETQKKYRENADCIVYQYGNYTAPENGVNLNGVNSQGENIADNGGIKQAYMAYQNWVANNTKEKRLPGLQEYDTNQAFWISAAQIWCSKYRPEALKIRIRTGVHSPGRFRVIGSFSNSEEFAKDWNCPVGSKMNPQKKCQVW